MKFQIYVLRKKSIKITLICNQSINEILHILIILIFNYNSFSQEFSFFNTDFSATSLSLGGNVIAKSDDISLTYKTTSLLNQSQKTKLPSII